MKNPKNKPLRIVRDKPYKSRDCDDTYLQVLAMLAVAESNLVKAGKDSAMPHFLAIVKEIEDCYNIKFEQMPDDATE